MRLRRTFGRLGDVSSIQSQIVSEANSAGVPVPIALAVAQQESNFQPNAYNPASGATGLFQLEPSSFPGQPIQDVSTNISLGVGYLAQLFQRFGNWVDALAAYDFGPTAVAQGRAWPAETQAYVPSVLSKAQ